ncbi:PH and SEC7 domain-containing protein isoform X2 [Chelonus insularis]|uniref:PH and SEC7 domain-containing protein isoform X2 n=1 Tax=Chelonus insularis TaxID=460826 RepID=UPI00158D536A|nr:PH and SEC7 domain-containing protein isoform X2 [Chelonus insularis]
MAEELMVTLNRTDTGGFGFSILGTAGLPHVIYDIVENSPAAESGKIEAGDIILRINDVDVNHFSTKEVLKCLRLSLDPVTLKLRRDPAIKAQVKKLLSCEREIGDVESSADSCIKTKQNCKSTVSNYAETSKKDQQDHSATQSSDIQVTTEVSRYEKRNGSYNDASGPSKFEVLLQSSDNFKEEIRTQWEPLSADKFSRHKNTPRFEAYMMTGDLMLNLSRTQHSTGLLPKYQKKVDSLRNNNHYIQRQRNFYNNYHSYYQHNSVPTSPIEMLNHRTYKCTTSNEGSNSARTSPIGIIKREISGHCSHAADIKSGIPNFGYSSGFVRTSRSEDHLQFQKDSSMSAVDIDIDDDVTSSLNTLLDTRPDSAQNASSERIVWTYNAPVSSSSTSERTSCCQNDSSSSSSSIEESSPQRSPSPASPTSVSSSVMSSNSSSRKISLPIATNASLSSHVEALGDSSLNVLNAYSTSNVIFSGYHPTNGDLSQSEAISNISSPDYNDEETMDILSARDIMMVSDPSDSDSTILASEPPQRRLKPSYHGQESNDHKIVIQVKGPEKELARTYSSPKQSRKCTSSNPNEQIRSLSSVSSSNVESCIYQEFKDNEDDKNFMSDDGFDDKKLSGQSPPQSADEESDIESLHSFHYSPKAVDLPSAVRLAKRLYSLDGFKKSDVSRHLCKNNDFSKAVAEEYLKYFNFEKDTLDVALRKFLAQFSLTGETQERERVLVHFSKRYIDCNPGSFNSQDAVHTLTCAIMLLNTDLHGHNIGRKMSCNQFIENLSDLNDGENFPREVLKQLYGAIKSMPLDWALDDEGDELSPQEIQQTKASTTFVGGNPFLDVPNVSGAREYKKGYVMRKCCYDANGKKTPFGKRGWKMYYCTLRELVLYLHKDEHSFRNDSLHNAIHIHHALATKASDYTKKQHVFRLQTADQAEYLFQTSDSKELQSWIDTINFVCASFSCQPLAGAVGSQRKFQRPLLPCSHTKLNPREQLRDHEERVKRLETELDEHRRHQPERGAKALTVQNYKEKDTYLHHELKRYKTYSYLLRSRLAFIEVEPSLADNSIGEVDEIINSELSNSEVESPLFSSDRSKTNRYSYRAAIYKNDLINGQDYGGDVG